MGASATLPVSAAEARPLRVLTPALNNKLQLANEVTRLLKKHDCQVVEVSLDHQRPLLRVTRAGGPLLGQVASGVIQIRPMPGVTFCRAYLLGCEIEWFCPSEEAN